jgi:hypothetical protein
VQKISGKDKRGRLKFSALPELNIHDVDSFKVEEKNVSAEQDKDMLEVSETTEIKTENINDGLELMNFEEENLLRNKKIVETQKTIAHIAILDIRILLI